MPINIHPAQHVGPTDARKMRVSARPFSGRSVRAEAHTTRHDRMAATHAICGYPSALGRRTWKSPSRTGRAVGPLAHAVTSVRARPRGVLAGAAIDGLAQDVRMPGVPA